MKHISDFNEGDHIREVFLCKGISHAVTKNGKEYLNVQLMDRTGSVDGKIWDPGDPGIDDFDKYDYVEVNADVNVWNNAKQLNIKRIRVAGEGEYDPAEYLPVSSRNNDEMYKELLSVIDSIEDKHYNALLKKFFVEDAELVKRFRSCSAAKTVHHGFVGGLMQHTLGVASVCDFLSKSYPVLNRDLLVTAALCHDIAKTKELLDQIRRLQGIEAEAVETEIEFRMILCTFCTYMQFALFSVYIIDGMNRCFILSAVIA